MTAKPYIPPAAKISNRASKPLREGTKARKEYTRKVVDVGPRWVQIPYVPLTDAEYDAIFEMLERDGLM
mgnify:CR=1 FL=1